MADLPTRRRLLGKKLLVVAGMSALSQLDCSSSTVANLVAPPEDAQVERDAADDSGMRDVPVANLLPPPDVATPTDDGVIMRDVPVANLIPPPDVVTPPEDVATPADTGVMMRDVPVANLIPPPPDSGR